MKKILIIIFVILTQQGFAQSKLYLRADSFFLQGAGIVHMKMKIDSAVGTAPSVIGKDFAGIWHTYSNPGWNLTGNSGTVAGTNFIGTTDNTELNFRVNNGLAGRIGTTANYNTSFGILTLPFSSTGVRNTAIGSYALNVNTTGGYNTGMGMLTLQNNTTGSFNTATGYEALQFNTTGSNNTAYGLQSLDSNTTGNANTGYGIRSLVNNRTGISNTAIGYEALRLDTSGSLNTAIGLRALYNKRNGSYTIGIGDNAGTVDTTQSNTLYISDSSYHMRYKLDSAAGEAPSVIGKDFAGNWHTYVTPVSSGTYTPGNRTYSGVATSSGADGTIIYSRVGSVVTVSGYFVVITNGSAGMGYVTFDLPIASNLSGLNGGGTAVGSLTGLAIRYPGQITIISTPGRATISLQCPAGGGSGIQTVFTFQYQIL